jgi:hypothetical protein
MVDLIQKDPERALQLTVPMHVIRRLPGAIRGQLEERVTGRGTLAVFGALPAPGKEKDFQPTFRTATLGNSEYDAFVYGRRLGEPTRENIPITGIAMDKSLAVSENPLRILEPAEVPVSKSSDPVCAVSGRSADEKNQRIAADIGGDIVFLCGAAHAVELNNTLLAQESGQTALSDDQAVAASSWTEGLKSLILIRVDFPDRPGAPFEDPTGIALISNVNAFLRRNVLWTCRHYCIWRRL